MKNKKLVSLVLAAAMATTVGVAAGCNPGGGKAEKLDAPVVSISGNVITWSAVEQAEAYDVYEGSTVVSEAQESCSYTIAQTNPGTYEYTVVATTSDENYTDSDKSNVVEYTVPAGDTSTVLTGKIYVVGDSTVCSFNDNYYLPRYGYGTQLHNFINCNQSQIVNLAMSGRSSLSFLTESNYTTLKNSISTGDYLVIGFGHNDEKTEADKYTNPNGDKDTAGSFQNCLYTNYVKMAKDKGATPILCTPIVRANSSNNYTGSSGHITTASGSYAGGDYAQAIRDLGTATGTTVVDLTALTKADYTALGYAAALDYHCWTATKNGVRTGEDTTHTNRYGAKMNAYHFATSILQSDNSLAANIRTDLTKPDHDTEYAASINSNYVEPDYEAPTLSNTNRSTIWTTVKDTDWYASAFGDVGGKNNLTANYFTIKQNSIDSFTVGNQTTSSILGKIASGTDGIASAFMQLDVNQNFKISATVTLDIVTSEKMTNNQSAFGIMLRDEMYIDTYSTTVNGNSVTAGGLGKYDTCLYNFSRLDGSASGDSKNSGSYAQGDTFTITMEKVNRTVTCTVVKGSTTYKTTYTDYTFTGIDTDNVYLCLFATRGIVATFSDIVYEAGDISEGA
ncbi:MAG: hypothetical protein K2J83_02485 [Clostridia bacterium]|nr:hypothetical protein [Clostridia bacterium]